jgi:hypothetical protein
MDNKARSFAVVVLGGSNKSIQAAQGQRQLIAVQGCGAQRAGPIKQKQWAPPDGQGFDSDGLLIMENNARWLWWYQDDEDNDNNDKGSGQPRQGELP